MRATALSPHVVVAVLLSLPGPLVAQQDVLGAVSAIEQSLWQGWKDHDAAPFREHVTENHFQIAAGGIVTGKAAVIRAISEENDCEVASFSLSNWQLHRIAENVVVVTYDASQDAVCGGQRLDPEVKASAVYVRTDGKWSSASYQESPRAQM